MRIAGPKTKIFAGNLHGKATWKLTQSVCLSVFLSLSFSLYVPWSFPPSSIRFLPAETCVHPRIQRYSVNFQAFTNTVLHRKRWLRSSRIIRWHRSSWIWYSRKDRRYHRFLHEANIFTRSIRRSFLLSHPTVTSCVATLRYRNSTSFVYSFIVFSLFYATGNQYKTVPDTIKSNM